MKIITAIITIFYTMMGFAHKVYAQNEWGGNELDGVNLGTNSLTNIITNIINVVLGFLGIIAVVIILYGGYLWMTSGGNAERVQRAKLALISGLIGLAIIVSAYAIASFFLREFARVTGVNVGGTGPGPGGSEYCECDGSFKVCAITPMLRSPNQSITIHGCNMGTAGTVTIGGELAQPVSCGGLVQWGSSKIKVRVPDIPVGPYEVEVDPAEYAMYSFSLSNLETSVQFEVISDDTPDIVCMAPDGEQEGGTIELQGNGFGSQAADSGIFFESTGVIYSADAIVADGGSWSAAGSEISFPIPDGTMSGEIQVLVGNGPAADEYSNPEWLNVRCTAGQCDGGAGCCTDGDYCREYDPYCLDGSEPRITNITPGDAGDRDIITIEGYNFGVAAGTVFFFNQDTGETATGIDPSAINGNCSLYWDDRTIIIGVPNDPPAGNSITDGVIQVSIERADGLDSNQYGWEKSDVDRPGICNALPNTGIFGALVDVYGVGFAAGNSDVLFGGVPDNVGGGCNGTECIDARVPNLVASDVSIQVQNNDAEGYISNPYPFMVLENLTGIPIVSELSPEDGPHRQYVTIKGSNFGNSVGSVGFVVGNATTTALDNFPDQCSDGVWTNTEIITIVPDLGPAAINDVEVIVTRAGDGEYNDPDETSNDFDYNLNAPTPGFCAMQPNNGPQGYAPPGGINLYGDNFQVQNLSSVVEFHDGQPAVYDPLNWQNQHIIVDAVPNNAQSGDVRVFANGERSNPLTFTVGECTVDPNDCTNPLETCCPTPGGNICLPDAQCDYGPRECEYTWHFTTEADPFRPQAEYCVGPSPWPDGQEYPPGTPISSQEVYEHSNILFNFNRDVYNEDLVNPDNFRVYRCQNGAAWADNCPTEVLGSRAVINNGSNSEGVSFTPDSPLEAGYWYKVEIGNAADGFRAQVGGDVWHNGLGAEFNHDEWHFRVREDGEACIVTNPSITPVEPDSNFMFDGQRTFSVIPMSDQCTVCWGQYNWDYDKIANGNEDYFDLVTSTNPRNFGRLTIDSNDSNIMHQPTDNKLPENNARVSATVTNPDATTATGEGSAVIESPDFRWTNRTPEGCSDACTNSQVRISFSTPIEIGDINNTNFSINPGIGENPVADDILPNGTQARTVIINGAGAQFAPGTVYNIEVDAGLRDIYGNAMSNWLPWTFETGDAGACVLDHTQILPQDIVVPIGDYVDYSTIAYSTSGVCYPAGQAISCGSGDCIWDDFTTSDEDVAATINAVSGLFYASSSPTPPPANVATIARDAEWTPTGAIVSADTTMTVMPGPPPPVYPEVNVVPPVSPAPGSTDVCINEMAYIQFDQPMNQASVEGNFEFFFMNEGPLNIGGIVCFEATNIGVRSGATTTAGLDYLCTKPSWSAQSINEFEFLVRGQLIEDKHYLAGVFIEGTGIALQGFPEYTGIKSIHDMSLDPSWIIMDLDNDTNDDGYFWQFDVGNEECVPNRVIIKELARMDLGNTNSFDYHMFTCGDHDCLEDEDVLYYNASAVPIPGNQKGLLAMTVGANGGLIGTPSNEFSWSFMDDVILDYQSRAATPWMSVIDVWPDYTLADGPEDGRDFLEVEYVMDQFPFATLTDRMAIDVNICDEPWPDPSVTGDYYWQDRSAPGNPTNFSTRYCQYTGNVDDEYLPGINYSPTDIDNPDNNILRDYLLIVDPNSTGTAMNIPQNNFEDQLFGSLAFKGDYEKDKESIFDRLVALKDKVLGNEASQAAVPCMCLNMAGATYAPNVTNLRASVSGGTDVTLSWNYDCIHDNFHIRRADLPNPAVSIGSTQFQTFNDVIVGGEVYRYEVAASAPNCDNESSYQTRIVGNPGLVDAIGVRVMSNPDNLSLQEWYRQNAPNPDNTGSAFEIDGFQAMQVGNTVYIDGVNTFGGTMYKNVYILSHNEDAHVRTLEVYDQLIENFTLNANWSIEDKGTNHCVDDTSISCSSDYDCPTGNCDSRALKLRRDLIRLGDLFDLDDSLYVYGVNNMYCDNNPNIPFGNDCPTGGIHVPYYPLLNEGTYVQGMSNSAWPSWDDNSPHDLSYQLDFSVASDPINQFNGCLDGYEVETCWSPSELEFYCQASSSIYMYNVTSSGRGYYIGANFEYDMDPWGFYTFEDDLYNSVGANGVSSINPSILTNLNLSGFCDGTVIESVPGPAGNYCGDGRAVAPEECDTNSVTSTACHSELFAWHGDVNWWNEQSAGCFLPGTPDQCTWYSYIDDGGYSSSSMAILCGGYCGNGELEDLYEQCDDNLPGVFDDNYTCDTGAVTCNNCQAMCGTELAAVCGDGILSDSEPCDESANPSGLTGYDCTGGAVPTCNSCAIECSIAGELPYIGLCGDGILSDSCAGPVGCEDHDGDEAACNAAAGCQWAPEECDYYGYEAPSPSETLDGHPIDGLSYACGTDCRYSGEYCGDGTQQYNYEELCDVNGYTSPLPEFSHRFNQYECRASSTDAYVDPETGDEYYACTPTTGGYCGNEIIEDGLPGAGHGPDYGEACDVNEVLFPSPPPNLSSESNQYACNSTCSGFDGGWCGDSIVHDGKTELPRHGLPYGEECDEGDYASTTYGVCDSISCEWLCHVDPVDGAISGQIGEADILFDYSTVKEVGPNEEIVMSLPACRGSGNLSFTIQAVGDIEIPQTAVIIITDVSYSMGYCVAGWETSTQPGSSWTCPETLNVSAPNPRTFHAVNGDFAVTNGAGNDWDLTVPGASGPPFSSSVFQTRLYATQEALLDPPGPAIGALDTIWDRNREADVAMIEFAGFVVSSTPFLPIDTNLTDFKTRVQNYTMAAATDHAVAINRAYSLIDTAVANEEYDNYVIIFMTDGECGLGSCEQTALNAMQNLKDRVRDADKHIDVFNILLTNPYSPAPAKDNLRGFSNALSTNGCEYTYDGNNIVPNNFGGVPSTCGDGTVDCVNTEADVNIRYEQCDGQEGCNNATCQWISDGNKRFYDFETEGGNLSGMYSSIANVIPIDGVTIQLDGESFPVVLNSSTISTDVTIPMGYLWNADEDLNRCKEFSGNFFNFRANYDVSDGGAATVTILNGKYDFCPWRNGGGDGQSYY